MILIGRGLDLESCVKKRSEERKETEARSEAEGRMEEKDGRKSDRGHLTDLCGFEGVENT